MKRIFILLTFFLSFSCFGESLYASCPQAESDDSAGFCSSFKTVAECHCVETGLPRVMCQDMNSLYNRMVAMFGSLQKACEYQHDTSVQTCIDDWNCYRLGGKDSLGRLCSAVGKSC